MMGAKQISFGPFWLDGQNECLWHGSQAISLRPKPFAVLKLLLAHAGQLVSKQQLLDSVWPGTFVGDAVLKDCIRQLREALNDDAYGERIGGGGAESPALPVREPISPRAVSSGQV